MSPVSFPNPPIIADPQPIPPEVLAASWIVRRTRVSAAHAALLRDLTGLGARREVSR